MGARESLVDCQPRKSGTNDYAKFEEGGGGEGGQNIFLENAGLSFLHR